MNDNMIQAIEDIKNSKLIIIVDDRNREHEGDLYIPAQTATVENLNFMSKFARGLMCAPLTQKRANELSLVPMVENPTDLLYTPFTISVDVKTAKTGISIYERHDTVKELVNPSATFDSFSVPGHMFPLVAKDGGILERRGHTEAAVDMARLAGLEPVGVICEIIKDDGYMARTQDLIELAKKWNLTMVSIFEIENYIKDNKIEFK